ncbi:(2Fe-2S)-binding protein [Polyangium aurulentum]|nr:(2Fe-2S)-binding protein [Polyangium aurulentum]
MRVHVLESSLGPACSAQAQPGEALVDVCDVARAPIAFSCRSASCGTCRVEVLEGAELLTAPSRPEQEILDIFEARPNERLACQAKLGAGEGVVLLRWAGED